MKILLISDTHGRIERVANVCESHGDFDLILHLGDYKRDQEDIKLLTGIPVKGVAGNCDRAHTTEECNSTASFECGKIFMTHGHTLGVNYDLTNLYLAAKEAGAIAAFYGHTHVAFYDESGDVRILCPGSISNPRDGTSGTYAIVNTDDGHLECRLFEYGKGPLTLSNYGRAAVSSVGNNSVTSNTGNSSDASNTGNISVTSNSGNISDASKTRKNLGISKSRSTSAASKSRKRGGFLRRTFNDSDGQ